ncbi:MAG: transglutaminase domain-containing protein [Lachnospiraceae bacterium]|nr:transglutaminase domain-containing protein [Lachnospiraceae bacterium]
MGENRRQTGGSSSNRRGSGYSHTSSKGYFDSKVSSGAANHNQRRGARSSAQVPGKVYGEAQEGGRIRRDAQDDIRVQSGGGMRRSQGNRKNNDQRINATLICGAAVIVVIVLVLIISNFFKKDDPEEGYDGSKDPAQTEEVTKSDDEVSPVISGVTNKTITVGDTISYLTGVTVTDNVDTDLEVEVDASQVVLGTPGEYTVVYKATDRAGNFMQVVATVTVIEKQTQSEEENSENYANLKYLANLILKRILTDDMSDMEKLGRIYDWVRFECDYVDSSDKSSWVNAALSMIDTRKGDCFSYFAVAKALLENAGFETVDVEKSNIEHSRHYWSLVKIDDGWYHYDTTPRHGDGDYFCMVTDAQLTEYSAANGDSHIWDKSLYPTVSEKVITDMTAEDSNVPVYKLNY